jgi:hypothetical protein
MYLFLTGSSVEKENPSRLAWMDKKYDDVIFESYVSSTTEKLGII